MTTYLAIAGTLCIGLMIGTEFAVSAFINPILEKLDDRTRLTVIRLFASRLGFAMPFWYGLGLLFLIGEAVIFRHSPQFPLLVAAAGLWTAVILLTLLFLVPINNRMAQLPSDAPAGAAIKEHKKWDTMHRVRVAALTVAMILFLVAVHS
jgi:uncharacterized membrane protein